MPPQVEGLLRVTTSAVLPPGTILQNLYLEERLRRLPAGRFVEVGTGAGTLSRLLLLGGWHGVGYEPSSRAAAIARSRNLQWIEAGRYSVLEADWLVSAPDAPADLVISAMVIEHLTDDEEAAYFSRAHATLAPGGLAILLVPASPRHWGIEDDIAGHMRRYTRAGLAARLEELAWKVEHMSGLTYPLSNWLLPLSNRLVARAEAGKAYLPVQQRTAMSGHRDVPMKTSFPWVACLLLNDIVLWPFHILQKVFRASESALVLYVECRPSTMSSHGGG